MPCPVHLSAASARTQQVMIASCRSASASPATQAASAGCSACGQRADAAGRCRVPRPRPPAGPATAMTTTSPECVSENEGAVRAPGARTGFPGAPQRGHRSRPAGSAPGVRCNRPAPAAASRAPPGTGAGRPGTGTPRPGPARPGRARRAPAGPTVTARVSNHHTSTRSRGRHRAGHGPPRGPGPLRDEGGERAQGGQRVQVQVLPRHVDAEPPLDLPQQERPRQRVEPHRRAEQRRGGRDVQQLVPPGGRGQERAQVIGDRRLRAPAGSPGAVTHPGRAGSGVPRSRSYTAGSRLGDPASRPRPARAAAARCGRRARTGSAGGWRPPGRPPGQPGQQGVDDAAAHRPARHHEQRHRPGPRIPGDDAATDHAVVAERDPAAAP